MSAGEILILLVVGIVVVGPQKLPGMMRTAGQWVARLRRMSTDLRAQSGIDSIIRQEGLENELRELRSLSRTNVLESLVQASAATRAPVRPTVTPRVPAARKSVPPPALPGEGAGDRSPASRRSNPRASVPPAAPVSEGASSAALAEAPGAPPTSTAEAGTTAATPEAATEHAAPKIAPAAAALIRAPVGAVARHEVVNPLPSFREREYPIVGCDHYEAFPDDLEDDLEGAAADELALAQGLAATAAASPPPDSPPAPSTPEATP